MISNTILMEQLNQYYDAWLQYNNVYEEWAKAHGLSVNCLLVLCAIYDSGNGCTQKKISGQEFTQFLFSCHSPLLSRINKSRHPLRHRPIPYTLLFRHRLLPQFSMPFYPVTRPRPDPGRPILSAPRSPRLSGCPTGCKPCPPHHPDQRKFHCRPS